MTKIFICDKCGAQFPQPLDEIKHKDEHGNWHSLDMCAPCRKELKDEKDNTEKEFVKQIIDKKVKEEKEAKK